MWLEAGNLFKKADMLVAAGLVAGLVLLMILLSGCAANGSSGTSSSVSTSTAWQDYADPDGDSSVDSYQTGSDYIRVRFTDGSVYLYTYASAGQSDVERMKQLARSGDGLSSFIMSNAKYDYESKQ